MRKTLAVLCVLAMLILPAPVKAAHTGETIPTVECVLPGYEYTDRFALEDTLAGYGYPASVDLGDCFVPIADIMTLRAKCRGTDILCRTDIFGVEVSTADREIVLSGTKIEDIIQLESVLECFPVLEKVEMCNCGLSNEVMERLGMDMPQIRFVWVVKFGSWKLRTDAMAFSTLNSNDSPHFTSEDFSVLRYCTDLRALDLGHNSITDLSWLEGLKEMRILILADNDISDISVLAKLDKLEYIELFMNPITDISPLRDLEYLLDLNVSHCMISDMSPAEDMKSLERLYYSFNDPMTEEEKERIAAALPSVRCSYKYFYATHDGWRGTHRYFVIKYIFDHGVYLPWDAEVPEK